VDPGVREVSASRLSLAAAAGAVSLRCAAPAAAVISSGRRCHWLGGKYREKIAAWALVRTAPGPLRCSLPTRCFVKDLDLHAIFGFAVFVKGSQQRGCVLRIPKGFRKVLTLSLLGCEKRVYSSETVFLR